MRSTNDPRPENDLRHLLTVAAFLAAPALLGAWCILSLVRSEGEPHYFWIAAATAVSLLIIFSIRTEYIPKLDRYEISGTTLNLIYILTNLVTLACVFPLAKLGVLLLRLVLDSLLSDGFSLAEWKAIETFLARPEVELAVLVLFYLVCLWKLVIRRAAANPFRKKAAAGKKGRTTVGPDGQTYSLPDSYKTGITYLLGADSDIYADSFRNSLHRLLWVTETLEHAQKLMEGYFPAWEVSNPGSPAFAEDSIVGRGVKWSQLCVLTRDAISGWRGQGDEEKAVKYLQRLLDTACLMAEKRSYPCFSDASLDELSHFDDLVTVYRKGRGNVKPSVSKALEWQNKKERFGKDWDETSLMANKKYMEHLEYLRKTGQLGGGSAATAGESSSGGSGGSGGGSWEEPEDTVWRRMPGRMTDSARRTYNRTSSPGDCPAVYACYDTGETIYIYRAVLHGGYADTDCGDFYY